MTTTPHDFEIKEITPAQYAELRGCKPQYIHKLLIDERIDLLPHVKEIKKFSRFYVLVVDKKLSKNNFGQNG